MAYPVPGLCPICGQKLSVSELTCHHCETTIRGDFTSCRFCNLSAEQKYFVEVFLKSRGNIKEVERELGISYPTVRSRLDNILEAMGYKVEQGGREESSQERRDILERLSRGDISAEDAVRLLKGVN